MIVSRKLGAVCVADIGWLEVRERVVERRPWVCRLIQSVSAGAGVFQCNLWNLLGCGGTVHRPQRTNEEDFCLGEIPCPSTSHAVVLLQTQSGA